MSCLSVNLPAQRAGTRLAIRSTRSTVLPYRMTILRPGIASNCLHSSSRQPSKRPTKPLRQKAEDQPKLSSGKRTWSGVRWNDMRVLPEVSNLWLRDACPCEKCVDAHSGQKTFSTVDLKDPPWWKSSSRGEDGSLTVVWVDALSGGQDHVSVYPAAMLPAPAKPVVPQRMIRRSLWNQEQFTSKLDQCRISYKDWMAGGQEFWDVMAQLATKGLVFVYDVPQTETSVVHIGEKIGPLQETFYGRTWDVVSKPEAENVAYTNRHLGLHQDLLYHPDTPRIQLLHCLDNNCQGGESLFSDGVHAAVLSLRAHYRVGEANMAWARYGYNKNGNVYQRDRPLFDLVEVAEPGTDSRTEPPTKRPPVPHLRFLVQNVWWSPPFQVPFPHDNGKGNRGPSFFSSYGRIFRDALEDDSHLFEYKMQPGECVVFDNWRVLHGRRQFDTQSGKRWLKGTYVADSVYTARIKDMPAAVAEKHALWTDTEKEVLANEEHVRELASRIMKKMEAKSKRKALKEAPAKKISKKKALVEDTTPVTPATLATADPLQQLLEINNKLVSALLATQAKQTEETLASKRTVNAAEKPTVNNAANATVNKGGEARQGSTQSRKGGAEAEEVVL